MIWSPSRRGSGGVLIRSIILVAALVLASAPLALGSGTCEWWDTSGCPPPALSGFLMNPGTTECEQGASFEVDLGTGALTGLSYYVREPDGTLLSQTHWGLVSGPTAWIWAPAMDASGLPLAFGSYLLEVVAENAAGTDAETFAWEHVDYDDVTPPMSFAMVGVRDGPPAVDGWYHGDVTVAAHGADDCGIPTSEVTLDGVAKPGFFTITEDGWYELAHRAVDNHGLASEWSYVSFGVDARPPSVAVTSPAQGDVIVHGGAALASAPLTLVVGPTVLTAEASDAGSGVKRVEWFVDGAKVGEGESLPYAFTLGPHTVLARATDHAGRTAESAAVSLIAVG